MTSFAEMKKNKNRKIEELQKDLNKSNNYNDDREWKLVRNSKTDIGESIIRFLPSKNPDDSEFYSKFYTHNFKSNGKMFYLEKSRTTLNGEEDPVQNLSNHYWDLYNNDNTNEPAKKNGSKFGRKTQYMSNILIVKDPENPENEGKVFLYKYGPAIMGLVEKALEEQEDNALTEKKVYNPSCPWDGANLLLKIVKDMKKNFYVYDDSKFLDQSPLAKTDKEMEKIWNMGYDLSEFTDPDTFKPYIELETHMNKILGKTAITTKKIVTVDNTVDFSKIDEEDSEDPFHAETEKELDTSVDSEDINFDDFEKALNG